MKLAYIYYLYSFMKPTNHNTQQTHIVLYLNMNNRQINNNEESESPMRI